MTLPPPSPLERLHHSAAFTAGVELYVKRDDLYTLAPGTALQGNKVRKLAPILQAALAAPEPPVLVSYGGAYSNHVSALATAGDLCQLRTHLIIRGQEVDNTLLRAAESVGATVDKISRSAYRLKNTPTYAAEIRFRLAEDYRCPESSIWIIPEGGTTAEGVISAGTVYQEIEEQLPSPPDVICVSFGTGGTAAGIIQKAAPEVSVEVYPALKGDWMSTEIERWLPEGKPYNYECITDYHFGGYGKFPAACIVPSPGLAKRADLGEPGLPPLEPIYTAKLFYGVLDRVRKGTYPKGTRIVIIHTGGIY